MPIDLTHACEAGYQAADDDANPYLHRTGAWRAWQFGRFIRQRAMLMPFRVENSRTPWLRVDGLLWAAASGGAERWQRMDYRTARCRTKNNSSH